VIRVVNLGRKTHIKTEEMNEWIVNYIRVNGGVSATDELFHEAFFQQFGGSRKLTMWGAQPVSKAMLRLKALVDLGVLVRSKIGLGGNWQPGFPKWNYVYFINENH
jgi:hypothetical protein